MDQVREILSPPPTAPHPPPLPSTSEFKSRTRGTPDPWAAPPFSTTQAHLSVCTEHTAKQERGTSRCVRVQKVGPRPPDSFDYPPPTCSATPVLDSVSQASSRPSLLPGHLSRLQGNRVHRGEGGLQPDLRLPLPAGGHQGPRSRLGRQLPLQGRCHEDLGCHREVRPGRRKARHTQGELCGRGEGGDGWKWGERLGAGWLPSWHGAGRGSPASRGRAAGRLCNSPWPHSHIIVARAQCGVKPSAVASGGRQARRTPLGGKAGRRREGKQQPQNGSGGWAGEDEPRVGPGS